VSHVYEGSSVGCKQTLLVGECTSMTSIQTIGYSVVLYCVVLYCIVLCCIVLYLIVSYCVVVCCIASYCIALYPAVRMYRSGIVCHLL
jgi:hypothetical protein